MSVENQTVKPRARPSLSGWARLWIVILATTWTTATLINTYFELREWSVICNWNGCPSYALASEMAVPSDSAADDAGGWLIEEAPPTPEEAAAELDRRADAWGTHYAFLIARPAIWAMWAVAVFVAAMILKSAALWVWQGFRRNQ